MTHADVESAVAHVRARIAKAAARADRDPSSVKLIAVTKGVSVEASREVVAAGVTDLGESRVHEAREKSNAIEGVRWHLLGHLQGNKASSAARIFHAMHSVDSWRIVSRLCERREMNADPLVALLEIDFTGLPTRTGVSADQASTLLRETHQIAGAHVVGLMTIAPFGDVEAARACFAQLRILRDRLQQETGYVLPELSMGMSDDFEVAIEEGATMVRIGRALFTDSSTSQ